MLVAYVSGGAILEFKITRDLLLINGKNNAKSQKYVN